MARSLDKDRGSVNDIESSSKTDFYPTEPIREKDGSRVGSPEANNIRAHENDLHGYELAIVVVGITLACFLMLLDNTIIVAATPRITTQFQSLTSIGWYGAAYELSSAVLNPLMGNVFANFNLRWTYLAFLLIFELGSLICGAANVSGMLIAGRAIAGLGSAGIQTGTMITITACVAPPRRPVLTGMVMGIAQLGFVAGPLIGGALTQHSTWRWCFYLNLPCGAVAGGLLLLARIPEPDRKPEPWSVLKNAHKYFDFVGVMLFTPPCVLLLLAVQWGGNTYSWDSSIIIGMLVGAGVSFMVWLAWDWYQKDSAMIPLSMILKRHVWTGCLAYGLMMSSLICALYYMPLYFQSVKGASATLSGVYMIPILVMAVIGAILAGGLVEKLGYYVPVMWFGSVCMSVGFGLLSTLTPTTKKGNWIGYQILVGFGRGLGLQMPFIAVQHNASPAEIPVVTALLIFSQTFGCSLSLSFADTIFTNTLQDMLRDVLSDTVVASIIRSGGVGFRDVVSSSQLPAVLSAFSTGIDRVFYMTAAFTALCFLVSSGMGWKDVREKPKSDDPV